MALIGAAPSHRKDYPEILRAYDLVAQHVRASLQGTGGKRIVGDNITPI